MQKPKEIAEISLALWYLPLDKLEEVAKLVFALKKEHGYEQPIDDSDEWTAEDKREFTEQSMLRLEAEEPWSEEWSHAQAERCRASTNTTTCP